jgi:hypothetical protein
MIPRRVTAAAVLVAAMAAAAGAQQLADAQSRREALGL